MLKNLFNDVFEFEGKDVVKCFKLALTKAQEFIVEQPQSSFEIVFDSEINKVKLIRYYTPTKNNFSSLFGPGDVPGYMSSGDLLAIAKISKKLPESGTFLEVGCFLGKSTVEWAKNLQKENKNYTIIGIDGFNSPINVLKELLATADFDIPPCNTQLELFNYYTKSFSNIYPLEVFFNEDFTFDQQVAGVFEDSDHTQLALNYALPYWWERIQPGGVLCGHDYLGEVKTAVDLFAILKKAQVETFDSSSIWCIEKN